MSQQPDDEALGAAEEALIDVAVRLNKARMAITAALDRIEVALSPAAAHALRSILASRRAQT
jgi:hypothetical protein